MDTTLQGCLDASRARALVNDDAIVEEMLDMLTTSLNNDVPNLQAAAQDQQWLALSHILHRLKGVLPLFCDERTADLLSRLESQFKTQHVATNAMLTPPAEVLVQFGQLLSRLVEFQISVQTWMNGRTKHA
jgi:HPt (histidine-containing phosphotransfer) domain-containing protein